MVRAILAFAFLIGIVLLHIFLSQTGRKWTGLILPVISFLENCVPFENVLSIM